MATDKRIVFKVEVDNKGAIIKLKSTNESIQDIDLSSKNAKQAVDRLTSSISKVGSGGTIKNVKLTTKEVKNLKNEVGGLSNKSGAAAATTLELGRVISDAPYGIRGMANNVSQVASQMAFMSSSTDAVTGKVVGFKGALKQVGAQIAGPLGILLAIQAVIAAVDFFWGSTQKATESVDDLNMSLDEQISKFTMLSAFFNEDRSGVVDSIFGTNWKDDLKILNNEFTEFGKKIESLSDEDKDNEELVKNLTNRYKNLLLIRTEITGDAKELKALEEDDSNEVGRIKALKSRLRLNYLLKAELEELFKVEKKTTKDKTLKTYKDKRFDLDSFILKANRDELLLAERHEGKKLEIKQDYEEKDLALNLESWVEKEKIRLKNFLASKATDGEKAKAKLVSQIAILDAEEKHELALAALKNKNNEETFIFDEKQRDKEIDAEFKYRKKKIDNLKAFYDEEKIARDEEQIRLEEERIAKAELDAERFDIGSTERFNADLKVAEMRMALQQRELDHELMIIQAKKNANMEYVNYMSNLGGLLSALSGQSEGMAKAALLVQKGSAIAKIVVETTAANAKIASQGLALAFETGGTSIAAAGKMVIANRINAGISIATILAQTISSMSSKGGGGGASGGGAAASSGRTFDFNLAGSTGQNQLAQTIGGQVQQPIKAYVVGSEITNQQQFDNQIQGEVTIG